MSRRVLILGGHGKVAQLLTPMLLARGWTVTSVIRTETQIPEIKALDGQGTARLSVLVRSLELVKSESDATEIIKEAAADYVVWSAGAAGKGGVDRTNAIDRDAAIHFVNASAASATVTRFIMVSALLARRRQASWWAEKDWMDVGKVTRTPGVALYDYGEAKIMADQALYQTSLKRDIFVCLRPGELTDEEGGKVNLGKTTMWGKVSRKNVARVADAILGREHWVGSRWVDVLDGGDEVEAAVETVVQENIDVVEGEPISEGVVG